MNEHLITFCIGMAGSAISATCGAGAGLLTSPYFILLGLPPQTAIGTAKFGGIGLTIGSLGRFKKTEHIRWEFVASFMLVSILAGIAGAQLLLFLNGETVHYIVVYAALLALPFLFLKKIGIEQFQPTKTQLGIGYVCKFFTESVQAAFGSGLGVLTSIVVMFFFGFTALEANATKRIPGLLKELVTIPAFAIAGIIAYDHGFALMLGSLVGGYAGAHIAVKKGNVFVKIMLAIVVAITAIMILIK